MAARALLFDLDGTIVDSERESAEGIARAMRDGLGLEMTQAERHFIIGHSWVDIYENLKSGHPGLTWTRDELIAASAAARGLVFQEQGIRILPGAVEAVHRFAHLGRAIVTGSSRVEAAQSLEHTNLSKVFEVVFASEDYARSKPAPDGYLAAAKALGVPPADCVVIEDSCAGVAAGRAAGAKVIAVRAGNFDGQDQSGADLILDTLEQLTDEVLAQADGARMNFDKLPQRVTVYEVGPRDGLQNESRMVPTRDKITFIDALTDCGLSHIEITSFVSPKWIPQLSDASDVAQGVARGPGVHYSALVPNRRGLDNAIAAGMREVAVFLSASETHNKKNVNKTIDETLAAFDKVVAPALGEGLRVRAYVSTVFGCPYEGEVDAAATVRLAMTLRDMGVYQISLGDTIGVANPVQVERVLQQILEDVALEHIAVHFHDTQGAALANCMVALSLGVETIDSSVGGLGGCPYAPGASGNLATEDLVAMLHGIGVETGIDLEKLIQASSLAAAFVGHELPSKYLKAHLGKQGRSRRRVEKTQSDSLGAPRAGGAGKE